MYLFSTYVYMDYMLLYVHIHTHNVCKITVWKSLLLIIFFVKKFVLKALAIVVIKKLILSM